MGDSAARLTSPGARGPIHACPGCGGSQLLARNHDDTVVFECVSCRVAWRYELSYVWPVRVDR